MMDLMTNKRVKCTVIGCSQKHWVIFVLTFFSMNVFGFQMNLTIVKILNEICIAVINQFTKIKF